MSLIRQNILRASVLAFVLTVALRFLLFFIGFNYLVRFSNFPLTTKEMEYADHVPQNKGDPWYAIIQPLHRFDALWYEEIGQNGYTKDVKKAAFFPFFPFITQLLADTFQTSFPVSALFLNTFLATGVFSLFYLFVLLEYGHEIATKSVILYALFPTSFFLLVPYAESLFFIFILLSLLFMKGNKLILATLFGCLATMTKPYGVAMILPLGYVFLKGKRLTQKMQAISILSMIFIGWLLTARYIDAVLGMIGTTIQAQKLWGVVLPFPFQPFFSEFRIFLQYPFDMVNDFNVLIIVSCIVFLWKAWKKINMAYWVFTCTFFILFYFTSFKGAVFFSTSRYVLLLFPIFVYIARAQTNMIVKSLYVLFSVALWVFFFSYYTFGFFVA